MAKKKSNGEGSIYTNGRYWVGQVTVGRNLETGKLKRKSFYGKTKKEVQEKLTVAMYELHNHTFIEPTSMLVKDWALYWLENFKKPNVQQATFVKIESLVRKHIICLLGSIQLRSLTVFQVQNVLNSMQKEAYSDAFIEKVYTHLKSMMRQAVNIELIKKNPCDNTVLPKSGKKRKVTALSKEEQADLVFECEKHKNGRLYIFLLGTGMRIGEALALQWDNVDLDNGFIIICKTIVEISGHVQINEQTKTKAGMRTIFISERIKQLLLDIQTEQDANKNKLNLVFPSQAYTINTSANIRVRFHKYCNAARVRRVNIHALRHTFATRALEQQINIKVLSKMLGHNDIKVTLNTYSHVLVDFERDSINNLDIFK